MRSSVRAGPWGTLWRSDRPVPWVTALVLVAFVLRTARLDFQPLWWDEGWTVYFATADIPAMVARTAIDIHPPFYYLLLHFWVLITGVSATSVRLFSVMAGTLSVPLVYVVGRRLIGQTAGLIAALVMALAPFHVYYSQEARMYALVTLLVLASVYVFLSLLERHRLGVSSWRYWVLYVSLAAMAMYTQYYAAFIVLALSVFIILRFGRFGGMLPRWAAAHALLLVLYLPWLLYAGPKLVSYVESKLVKEGDISRGLWAYFRDHLVAFSVGHPSDLRFALSGLAAVPVGLAVLSVVALLVARRRRLDPPGDRAEGILFAVTYMLVPLSLGYLVNLRYPFTSPGIERLFLLSAPAFFLLVGAGLSWLREQWRVPGAVLLALVVGMSALPL
ncbi:MAG TPA: glycosyltransferase family 39 protein, partial [Anaerolineae bacterium]|nr:glycosyltransferase family 39 protein [Anaerolineae bacterium]